MTETAVVEATTTTAPRESLSREAIRDIRGGHILLVARDEYNLSDTSGDEFMYADSRPGETVFNAYTLSKTGATENWVTGLSNSRIVEHVSTDYDTWRQGVIWRNGVGSFANINPSYFSHDFRQAVSASGHSMSRYTTYVEVLAVHEATKNVDVRVFSTQSETPDAVEYGKTTLHLPDLPSVNMIDGDRFRKSNGLTKDVWPVGSLWQYEAELYAVEWNKGHRALFRLADENNGLPMLGGATKELTIEYSSYVSKVAMSPEEYMKTLPNEEVREALNLLSRNTVTRALKHADSNDYCKETAVALTSAGHVIPEMRVKGTITIEVDFTSKDYMLLRRSFGLANDDVSNLTAVLKNNYLRLAEHSGGKLPRMAPNDATKFDLSAEIVWKTPKLRPLG